MAEIVVRLVGARIRSDWQYRVSFVTFLIGQGLVTALEFVTILILLQLVPSLGGWSTSEVVFLYALATVPFALADMILSSVEVVSTYVRSGNFDRLLLRPISPLVQVATLEFELRRVGKLIPTTAALVWAVVAVDIDWTLPAAGYLVIVLVSGTVIYSALWVMTAALSFWLVAAQEATNGVTYGGQFANQYPFHLYPGWVRAVLGWAIPLVFVAYVPTIHLLDAPDPLDLPNALAALPPIVAAGTALIAGGCWRLGIRHYQSTGS